MTRRTMGVYAVFCLLAGGVAAAGCGTARGEAALSGDALYGSCASCHGEAGEGDVSIGAPKLASLPRWYLALQLQRFKDGRRGKHVDDVEGLKMRAMAMQMSTEAEIDAVSTYIAGLPAQASPATVTADAAAGEESFAVCTACHGDNGEGNEALEVPPLAGMEDWYVARQLRKFQSGVRGAIEDDRLGTQMASMALTVDPDDVDGIAAYVRSLSR